MKTIAAIDARKRARWDIIAAANAHKNTTPYGMRHLQQAVFMCRQRNLVGPHTLDAAGFRPARIR